jgi:DNA polymerase-3 subunit epsilon
MLTRHQSKITIFLSQGGVDVLNNLTLERPLAFIDVETTGLRPSSDRIVELSILKIHADGSREYKSHRVNPEIPIPADVIAIHGITDADVAYEPKFQQYAKSIRDFLDGCDIAGFNVIKFDLPFLEAEFKRAGIEFSRKNRHLVDVQVLYHLLEPRDLNAAHLKYCGREMEINHTAEGDATASAEILDGQLEIHPELPRNVSGLCAMCYMGSENYVDPDGKFVWSDGEVVCNFGKKHNGRRLKDIAAEDPDYLQWIAREDFTPEVKEMVSKALLGEFPKPQG